MPPLLVGLPSGGVSPLFDHPLPPVGDPILPVATSATLRTAGSTSRTLAPSLAPDFSPEDDPFGSPRSLPLYDSRLDAALDPCTSCPRSPSQPLPASPPRTRYQWFSQDASKGGGGVGRPTGSRADRSLPRRSRLRLLSPQRTKPCSPTSVGVDGGHTVASAHPRQQRSRSDRSRPGAQSPTFTQRRAKSRSIPSRVAGPLGRLRSRPRPTRLP